MDENEEYQRLIGRYTDYIAGKDSGYFDTDELHDLLNYYIMQNDKEAVQGVMALAKHTHPRSIETMKMQAMVSLFSGELVNALNDLKKIGSDDFEAKMLQLTTLLAMNKKSEAKELAQSIYNSRDMNADMAYDIARCFAMTMNFRIGVDFLKKCMTRYPDDYDLAYLCGQFYDILNKPRLAEDIFHKLTDKDPFDANVWFSLAELYLGWDKIPKALTAINYAVSINPHDIPSLYLKAEILALIGKTKESNQVLLDALQEGASEVDIYLCIGRNYMEEEQYKTALEWYDKADKKVPDSKRVMLCKFDALIADNDIENACKILDRLSQTDIPTGMLYERMGMINSIIGKYKDARTDYIKAVKYDPNNPQLLTKLSMVEFELGNYKAAKKHVSKALDIDESFLVGYMVLSATYCKLGQYKKMLEIVGDPIFLADPHNRIFFELCPEMKPNFKRIIDALRNKKDIQTLLVYPSATANNN